MNQKGEMESAATVLADLRLAASDHECSNVTVKGQLNLSLREKNSQSLELRSRWWFFQDWRIVVRSAVSLRCWAWRLPIHIFISTVMSRSGVSSLVFRFWSLPWTNGSNIQLKWKLRYSPSQYAYVEPTVTQFADRRRNRIGLGMNINTELLVFAMILRLMCWCLDNPLAVAH